MFWIFDDEYSCIGFFTQILYVLTPIAFLIQLKNDVLHKERVSMHLYIFGQVHIK